MLVLIDFLYVMLGGALGAALRYAVTLLTEWASPLPGYSWVATLVVNILGSFAIGYLSACGLSHHSTRLVGRPFFVVGLCGGFTTFSTFALDLYGHYSRGAVGMMILYLVASVALSVLALLAGLWAGSRS